MKKNLLLLALLGFMLTGCGSESEEDFLGENGVESVAVEVAEVTTTESEWVELKIPESTVAVEEVKETEPKLVFTEEYKEEFSKEIERFTGYMREGHSAECLGIEHSSLSSENSPLSNNPSLEGYTWMYFLIDDTEIIRVHKDEARWAYEGLVNNHRIVATNYKSTEEFEEAARSKPHILVLDRSSTPLFVDADEVTDYAEHLELVIAERENIEEMAKEAMQIEAQSVDETTAKAVAEQTVSRVDYILSTYCGEDYSLWGYSEEIYGDVEKGTALIHYFFVETAEGKYYKGEFRDPTQFITGFNLTELHTIHDSEELMKYIGVLHSNNVYMNAS